MDDLKIIKRIIIIFKRDLRKLEFVFLGLVVTVSIMALIPKLNQIIIDNGFANSKYKIILVYSIIIYLIQQINLIVVYFVEKTRLNLVLNIKSKLQEMVFSHLQKVRFDFFDSISKADLLSKLDIDINAISSLFTNGFYNACNNILIIICGIIGISLVNLKFITLFLIVIPIKIVIVNIFSKRQHKSKIELLKRTSQFASWMEEILAGIRELRIFGVSNKILSNNYEITANKIIAENKIEFLNVKKQITDNKFNQVLNLCIYLIGGYYTVRGNLTLGELLAFISYTNYILSPINSLISTKIMISNILPSVKRFFEFLDIEEEKSEGIICNSNSKCDLRFDKVNFHYNGFEDHNAILKNITLQISSHSKVALLGSNGSGKSTFIEVLLGLYKIESGTIYYNDTDIKDVVLCSIRQNFSYVSQYFYLFNNSIRYNIALNINIEDELIYAIINDVGLSDLVDEKGLDYVIGVNGAYLSGGQRQKLALARALAHSRNILILDEITSNTDEEFETRLKFIIDKYLCNKSLLLITHNKKLVKLMDYYIKIENGSIIYDSRNCNLV